MKRVLCLLALLILTAPAAAAGPSAIGYVDMERVLQDSEMGRKATAELEKKFGGKQQELAQEEQAIRQLQQTLNRDQALISQAELDKRTSEIQKRIMELQKKAAAIQQEVSKEQAGLLEEILVVTRQEAAKLAREKKLAALFERSRSGLLYIDDSLDVTGDVIKRLNARPKKK
jgi:outer membrane protein